jgi:hypothetical protein
MLPVDQKEKQKKNTTTKQWSFKSFQWRKGKEIK